MIYQTVQEWVESDQPETLKDLALTLEWRGFPLKCLDLSFKDSTYKIIIILPDGDFYISFISNNPLYPFSVDRTVKKLQDIIVCDYFKRVLD